MNCTIYILCNKMAKHLYFPYWRCISSEVAKMMHGYLDHYLKQKKPKLTRCGRKTHCIFGL